MKKLALAILAAATFAAPALAADMAARPVKAPIAPAPVFSWTGCYIGGGGGYGMSNDEHSASIFAPPAFAVSSTTTSGGRGWFGTVQVGCDYQVAPNWVIGAFGDVDFSSIKGNKDLLLAVAPGTQLGLVANQSQDWSWAAGGRIGYLPFERLLAYVSAGYTQAHYKQTDYVVFPAGIISAPAAKYSGWFVGSGYEYALGFLPGLFWKTEYRFSDYGNKDQTLVILPAAGAGAFVESSHKYTQTIRSELVYRFNWGRY